MRRPICFILAIVFYLISFNTLSAQVPIEKGIKGGVNFSKFIGDDADLGPFDVTREYTTTFAIGGYLTIGINDQFSIRPEAYYSVKGCHYKESKGKDEKLTISMNYIDIPVLGIFQVVEDFSIFVGPSLGIYLNGEIKIEAYGNSETSDLEDLFDVNSPDFSLLFGANYFIERFHLDVRYLLGLTNLPDVDQDVDLKHGVIQIMIGYGF